LGFRNCKANRRRIGAQPQRAEADGKVLFTLCDALSLIVQRCSRAFG
jgi:hypothetical protein